MPRALAHLASRPPLEQARRLEYQPAANARGASGRGVGDEAFEQFFRAHEREIFGYLWRLTGDEHASYDLAQETFVRAWQRFERVRRYDRPRAWLFRVATNLASNHRRHRSVREAATARLGSDSGFGCDPGADIAEADAVRSALDALPMKQRGALVLRVVYGLSIVELAHALGSSEAGAKMTLSRARQRFRTYYTQEEP